MLLTLLDVRVFDLIRKLFVKQFMALPFLVGNGRNFEGIGGCISPNPFKISGSHPVNPCRPIIFLGDNLQYVLLGQLLPKKKNQVLVNGFE
jgi:hypothetical protein